jgi:hypothetical protein
MKIWSSLSPTLSSITLPGKQARYRKKIAKVSFSSLIYALLCCPNHQPSSLESYSCHHEYNTHIILDPPYRTSPHSLTAAHPDPSLHHPHHQFNSTPSLQPQHHFYPPSPSSSVVFPFGFRLTMPQAYRRQELHHPLEA